MPRIRSIKPEALQHRKVARLSDRAFRLWMAMLTQADDEGRFVADPEWLRTLTWGYHPSVTVDDVREALHEVTSGGLVVLYHRLNGVSRDVFGYFPSWLDHQKIDRPRPSQLPSPSTKRGKRPLNSTNGHRALDDDSTGIRRGSEGSEGSDRIGRIRSDLLPPPTPPRGDPVPVGLGAEAPAAGPDEPPLSPEENAARAKALASVLAARMRRL